MGRRGEVPQGMRAPILERLTTIDGRGGRKSRRGGAGGPPSTEGRTDLEMMRDCVAAFYEALTDGDWPAVQKLCTTGVSVRYHDAAQVLPWGGLWVGPRELRRFFDTVNGSLAVVSVTPVRRIEADDGAIVVLDGVWQVRRNRAEIRATVINRFVVSDGLIDRFEVFPDSAAFGLALGTIAGVGTARTGLGPAGRTPIDGRGTDTTGGATAP